jgi:hypothetical protein
LGSAIDKHAPPTHIARSASLPDETIDFLPSRQNDNGYERLFALVCLSVERSA